MKVFSFRNLIFFSSSGVLVLFFFLPDSLFNNPLAESNCLHQIWFSKPCPGCGMTRALYYSIHLDLYKAINLNPSVIFLLFAAASELIYQFKKSSFTKKLRLIMYTTLCISLFFNYLILLYS